MTEEFGPNNSFDVISMLDVLEHIPPENLSNFANMVYQKLKQNGIWIIKVPSTDGPFFSVAHFLLKIKFPFMEGVIKRLWQSDFEFPHTVYFNRNTLTMYLENHGFKVDLFQLLEEVPNATVLDRLLIDNTFPFWQAILLVPGIFLINFINYFWNNSDSMLMVASRY